jgi:hypothetical protein
MAFEGKRSSKCQRWIGGLQRGLEHSAYVRSDGQARENQRGTSALKQAVGQSTLRRGILI